MSRSRAALSRDGEGNDDRGFMRRRPRVQRAAACRGEERVRRGRDAPDAVAVAPLLVPALQGGRRPARTAKLHADIARAIAKGDEDAAAGATDRLLDKIRSFYARHGLCRTLDPEPAPVVCY
jgi:DNA-binding GntR family transcriptional regulator